MTERGGEIPPDIKETTCILLHSLLGAMRENPEPGLFPGREKDPRPDGILKSNLALCVSPPLTYIIFKAVTAISTRYNNL